MKKITTILIALFCSLTLWAQSPQKMSYQAVIRNSNDSLITNAPIGMRISILQGSASGTAVYVETHTTTSNANALITVEIGDGTAVTGTFAAIDWSNGPYFIKTETDPAGGSAYSIIGSSELLSVPYALFSANGTPGPAGVGIANTVDNGDGTFTLNYSDGSSFTTSDLTGPAGVGIDTTINNGDGTFTVYYTNGASFTTADFSGPTGVGISSTVNNGDGTYTFNYSDGSSFTTSNLTGPAGPAGPVAGSDQQIIFNNAGTAAGSANLTWNEGTTTHTVNGTSVTNNARITSLGGLGLRYVTADNNGDISANTFPGIIGSGSTNYHVKWTSSSTVGNSLIQDNGTSLSINYPIQSNCQMFVYRQQQTATGDGQSTLQGYRDRNTQNQGTSYGQVGSNTGVTGSSFWGDDYSFGTGGWNYNDFVRTGGVIGAEIYGAYFGILGYKSSSTNFYGVYGSNAYGNGTGLLPSTGAAGIGGGFYGNFIGSTSKGSVVGQLNSGDLFSQYNNGNLYTVGKNVELVKSADKVNPMYTLTSTESNIYAKGRVELTNGTAHVAFTEEFKSLLNEIPVITVTANGECKGVYVASVDKDGFTIKEFAQGNSNASISWIAVGVRIDNQLDLATKIVTAPDFDRNIQQVLYSDGNLEGKAMGIWWDGSTIRFGEIPAKLIPSARRDGK
jgi:hypothetical protein